MAVNIGDLEATIRLLDELSPSLKQVEKNVGGFSAKSSLLMGVFQGAGIAAFQAVSRAAMAAVGAVAGFVKSSTLLAVAAVESESLFEVSFGSMAAAAREWSEETSAALGLNAFEIRRQSGILFTMVSSMGVAKDAAFEMSTGLTTLAADMASFFDLPMEEAFNKLSAGISGEIEPLKRLGIVITIAEKKSKALEMGILKQGEAFTEAAKVQAFYALVMEKTITAQGDLARTIDSPANAMRILSSQFEQFQINIGQAFLPALQGAVKGLGSLLAIVMDNEDAIKSFITGGIMLMADALVVGVFAVDELVQWYVRLAKVANFAALGVQLFVRTLQLQKEMMLAVVTGDTMSAAQERYRQDVLASTRGTRDMIAGLDALGKKSAGVATTLTDVIGALKETAKAANEAGAATDTAGADAARAAKDAEKLAAEMAKEAKAVQDATDAWEKLDAEVSLEEVLHEISLTDKAIQDATDAWEKLDAEVTADELADEIHIMARAAWDAEQATRALQSTMTGLLMLGDLLGGSFGDLAGVISAASDTFGNMRGEIDRTNAALSDGTITQAEADAANLTSKIVAVAAAAGMLGDMLADSTNPNLQKLGGALQGAAAGAQMGSAFGPWGAAIGAVGGAVVGLANSWNAAEMATNDARDAFFESFGGFEDFSAQMAEVSDEDWAAKIFSAKTVEEFNALVAEATGLLDEHQAALQLESDSWAAVEDAADRYGLTLEEMGPKFAARELSEKAGQLFQDFQLLIAAGADLNAVLAKMGPEVSDFVNQSIRAGVAIPAAMEPMLQQMADAGVLLDENGVAITNLEDAGVTFAQTMDEMFTTLIEKIDAMVNALMGINDVTISPNVATPRGGSSIPSSAQQGFFTPSMPTSGAQDGGRNIRVHGGEEVSVTPATFGGGDGGGEQQLQVVVNIGNEKLYDLITKATKTGQVRVFPDAVKAF